MSGNLPLAVQKAIEKFLQMGVLQQGETEGLYSLTGRGRAWVKEIIKVPAPKQAWVNAQGEVVGLEGA